MASPEDRRLSPSGCPGQPPLWTVAVAWGPVGPCGQAQGPVCAPEAQLCQEAGSVLSLWVDRVRCPHPVVTGGRGPGQCGSPGSGGQCGSLEEGDGVLALPFWSLVLYSSP